MAAVTQHHGPVGHINNGPVAVHWPIRIVRRVMGEVLMAGEEVVAVPWKAWAMLAAVIAPLITAAFFIGTVVPKVNAAYEHAQLDKAGVERSREMAAKLDEIAKLLGAHLTDSARRQAHMEQLEKRVTILEGKR